MGSTIRYDITILGAGPAGITAAISLAKKGIPVLLIDKCSFPRQKICGDGLSGKVISNLNRLNPDYVAEIQDSGLATNSHSARFFSPNRKMIELSFQTGDTTMPAGFISQRFDFDNFLLHKALEFNEVTFIDQINIEKLDRKDGALSLYDDKGNLITETRLLLFAAGSNRNLIRQLDPAYPDPEEGIGIRGYFDNVSGSDHKHAIEIHFFKELLPWYFWIFPFSDGSANVGLALPETLARKSNKSLKELLYHIINTYPDIQNRFKSADLRGKLEAARLAYYTGPVGIAGDNYILLGDAARLIDPFSGEGIGNALASGRFAAETAMECINENQFSFSKTAKYQQTVEAKLVPELALSLRLQSLAKSRSLLNLVIGRASKNEKTRRLISAMLYDPEIKKKLSKPGFYMKILL